MEYQGVTDNNIIDNSFVENCSEATVGLIKAKQAIAREPQLQYLLPSISTILAQINTREMSIYSGVIETGVSVASIGATLPSVDSPSAKAVDDIVYGKRVTKNLFDTSVDYTYGDIKQATIIGGSTVNFDKFSDYFTVMVNGLVKSFPNAFDAARGTKPWNTIFKLEGKNYLTEYDVKKLDDGTKFSAHGSANKLVRALRNLIVVMRDNASGSEREELDSIINDGKLFITYVPNKPKNRARSKKN